MGTSSINGQFSMAMLNNQRVYVSETLTGVEPLPMRFRTGIPPYGTWQ